MLKDGNPGPPERLPEGAITPMTTYLGRYTVDSEIGQGGQGIVYRAHDSRLGKMVALKVLRQAASLSSDTKARFRQEARAAAILSHPSIASVSDYAEEDGTPVIVYELVEGTRLDKLIGEGRLNEQKVIQIGSQVADALAYAHERGILHRDIKPQNIIVTREGTAKVLDFGLAKKSKLELVQETDQTVSESPSVETARGTIVGTVHYMSPEQIGGERLDGRTDIFSLGVVLYEMVAGSNPFRGESFASTIGKIMTPDTPPIQSAIMPVSLELQEIIRKCLQKKRDDRYPSAKMVADDLDRLRTSFRGQPRPLPIAPAEVQVIPARMGRALAVLLQIMYLAIYGVALFYLNDLINSVYSLVYEYVTGDWVEARAIARGFTTLLMVTGIWGVAIRLYLLASLGFNDPETGRQFRKLFPFLFVVDEIWALTPLLLYGRWRPGLTLLFVAMLAYVPMSQRYLIKSAYPWRSSSGITFGGAR